MKIWNQSKKIKFDPVEIVVFRIEPPGYQGILDTKATTQFLVVMTTKTGEQIGEGLYESEALATARIDYIDRYAKQSCRMGESVETLRSWLKKELQKNKACLEAELSSAEQSDYLGKRTAFLKVRDKMDGLLEDDK